MRLFADLRRYLPRGSDGPILCCLPAGATVADALAHLGIPGEQEVTAGLNGRLAQCSTSLAAGDEVDLFSPMEGG